MAQIATVVVADSAAANHNFLPVGVDLGIATYEDRVGGIALGFPVLTTSQVRSKGPRGQKTYKTRLKLVFPVLEVTSPSTASGIQPAPTLAYDLSFDVTFATPERSTLLERQTLYAFFKNFAASAVVKNQVEAYDVTY